MYQEGSSTTKLAHANSDGDQKASFEAKLKGAFQNGSNVEGTVRLTGENTLDIKSTVLDVSYLLSFLLQRFFKLKGLQLLWWAQATA